MYIDQYINNVEIFPIQAFIESFRGTMLGTMAFQQFIISLRKYNQRAKRKIKFYGIDLEFQENITTKMQEYAYRMKNISWQKQITKNKENTARINSLDDEQFEVEREKALVANFFEVYKSNGICFMGAWHIRKNSSNNFIKKVQLQISSDQLLAIEILYKNSKRTIQGSSNFKIIKVNDYFDKNEYYKYGNIHIMKKDDSQGIISLENCINTKMII